MVTVQEKNIQHNGNLTMADVIDIARIMRYRSCAINLAGTCKEILGTCVSVGCTVDHEEPREIQAKVSNKSSTSEMNRITLQSGTLEVNCLGLWSCLIWLLLSSLLTWIADFG